MHLPNDSRRGAGPRCRGAALLLLAGLGGGGLAADAGRGEQLYEARCGGCHSIEADRVGPRHSGLLGRRAGAVPGFDYSAALRSANFVWSEQQLDRWLAAPEALVPGQKMNVSVANPADRADLIAYLSRAAADPRAAAAAFKGERRR